MEVRCGLSNVTFHLSELIWPQPLLKTQSANKKDHTVPSIWHQLPGGRLGTLVCFHHGRGRTLLLPEETLTLDMDGFTCNTSAKTSYLWIHVIMVLHTFL